jgi:hypothetical protein
MSNAEKFYSDYLWAYTLSVSGGVVSFTVDEGEPETHGWPYVHAYQYAVLLGAMDGRMTDCIWAPGSISTNKPIHPKSFEEFKNVMGDIPSSLTAEPLSPPTASG